MSTRKATAIPGHANVYFALRHDKPISARVARKAQTDMGYPPKGHGFHSFITKKTTLGYAAQWSCKTGGHHERNNG